MWGYIGIGGVGTNDDGKTSAEVGWFGYSRINKGGLSVHSYLLHLIIEK
jgi:hypothetical protein